MNALRTILLVIGFGFSAQGFSLEAPCPRLSGANIPAKFGSGICTGNNLLPVALPGADITLYWNSNDKDSRGVFGNGWRHSYMHQWSVEPRGATKEVELTQADGSVINFVANGEKESGRWLLYPANREQSPNHLQVRYAHKSGYHSRKKIYEMGPNGLQFNSGDSRYVEEIRTWSDAQGLVLMPYYSGRGASRRLEKIENKRNKTQLYFNYDQNNRVTSLNMKNDVTGRVTASFKFNYTSNRSHQLISITETTPGNNRELFQMQFDYDRNGRVTRTSVSENAYLSYIYDSKGRLSEIKAKDNTISRTVYGSNYIEVYQQNARVHREEFAAFGGVNMITKTLGQGNTSVSLVRQRSHPFLVSSATSEQNISKLYTYNSQNLLAKLVIRSSQGSNTTEYSYGGKPGYQLTQVKKDGAIVSSFSYDSKRMVTEIKNPLLNKQSRISYSAGKTNEIVNNGVKTKFSTSGAEATTDHLGRTTQIIRDRQKRVSEILYPSGNVESFIYSENGALESSQLRGINGAIVRKEYHSSDAGSAAKSLVKSVGQRSFRQTNLQEVVIDESAESIEVFLTPESGERFKIMSSSDEGGIKVHRPTPALIRK